MCLDTPPDPDYTDLDWCEACRSPVFDEGCECSAACATCGELTDREKLAPGAEGQECPACRELEAEDAVPVAVDEEEHSGAQTVRAIYEPIGDAGLGDVRATRRAAA